MVGFYTLLATLDGPGHHARLDGLIIVHAHGAHEVLDSVTPEDPHQIVLKGQVEATGTRIPLATGSAAKLVVDAPALVAFRAQDVQPTEGHHLLMLRCRLFPHFLHEG